MSEKKQRRTISFAERLSQLDARIALATDKMQELKELRATMVGARRAEIERMNEEIQGA